MNGENVSQTFTDFLSPSVSDEGPVSTTNIERTRYKRKRGLGRRRVKIGRGKKRRTLRAS